MLSVPSTWPWPDGLLVPKAHAAGELAQLVLRDARHDRQAELAVLLDGVDAVVLEDHGHAVSQQVARVGDAVHGVAGKARDFLGNDEVKAPGLGILDHALKADAALGADAGDALVHIALHERPVWVCGDLIGKILDLVGIGKRLLLGIRGDARVKGHPQRDLPNIRVLELLPNGEDVHGVPPTPSRVFPYSISRLEQACKLYEKSDFLPNLSHIFSISAFSSSTIRTKKEGIPLTNTCAQSSV